MKEQTCCFTGHRNIEKSDYPVIKAKTKEAVLRLTEYGVKYFGAGGAKGYDTLAAEVVLGVKKEQPQVRLIPILPCPEQTKGWLEEDIRKYEEIKSKADKVVYTSDHYFRGCMHVRNRYLVDHSGYCICYLTKATGGTAFTVNYADKQGLKIINTR